MGCAASATSHQSVVQHTTLQQHQADQQFSSAPTLHPRQAGLRGAQQPQQPPPQQPQQQGASDHLKSAPLVKSLVAIKRNSCKVESSASGATLNVSCMTSAPGKAVVYFRAAPPVLAEGEVTPPSLDPLEAKQITRATFESNPAQDLQFQFCSGDLRKALEGSKEDDDHQLVIDLLADSSDAASITVQRSFLKLVLNGDAVACTVAKQMVQCGNIVRTLDALYGTLPNPKKLGTPASGEIGECVVCMSETINTVILHCRHVCLCSNCAKMTSSTWSFQCPVCRGRVAAMVHLDGTPIG